VLAANGGGGGAGQPSTIAGLTSTAGSDASSDGSAAPGGIASGLSGNGGDGASLAGPAGRGVDGQSALIYHDSGGGGGGGTGRIAIHGASQCAFAALQSPLPSVTCESCGACPTPPSPSCNLLDHAGTLYFDCISTSTWQAARTACRGAGYELVHVHDAAENTWLASQIPAESWLGGSGTASTNSTWTWSDDGTTFYSGGSATAGVFTSWGTGQPLTVTASHCATLSIDGQWRDRNCAISYGFVCQVP